jgi:DNA-binding winged helix-turn-helix (wHTH) protein
MGFPRLFHEEFVRTRFGSLTLDTDARQLLRGSEVVPLSPKAFDLLALLLEHRPRALSKSELHERLWPETFVTESNLAGLVAEIRRAVQDDARTPRFVRTVQRFGYAFAGTVGDAGADAAPSFDPSGFWLSSGRRKIPLMQGENVLGRDADAGGFDSATVSRRHARIVIEGERAYLEDLGSKNGTSLHGQRIGDREALADGDTIGLGAVVLRFHMPSNDRSTRTWKGRRRS